MFSVSFRTTSCFVACITIPVRSSTPLGGSVVSYSINSALPIEPDAHNPTRIVAAAVPQYTKDKLKLAVLDAGTV